MSPHSIPHPAGPADPAAVVEPTDDLRELLRVGPGRAVDLSRVDARATPGLPDLDGAGRKQWARAQGALVGAELGALQERLTAGARTGTRQTSVLLVLQAMDCGGKDGAVRRLAGAMNPLGLDLVAFGRPTAEELRHHFLWRVRRALPRPGQIGVFNRSHYEDVLVARVRELVPADTWRTRYEEINRFEAQVVAGGTPVVKVFLHISPQEQAERLGERLTDPHKHWKYDPADLDDRRRWADYQAAYETALTQCSTDTAPWFVLPADRKWYRDWALAHLLRATLLDLDLHYPPATFDVPTERARLAALTPLPTGAPGAT